MTKPSEQEALKSARDSYLYALNVLEGRFEKGEDIISKDAYYSYYYALKVLKGRFEKGEDVIDAYCSKLYKENIYNIEKELKIKLETEQIKLEKEKKELEKLKIEFEKSDLAELLG